MNSIDVHVGLRLSLRRSMLGLSRDRLAASLGCDEGRISDMESGARRVSVAELMRLSWALRVRPSWFFEQMD